MANTPVSAAIYGNMVCNISGVLSPMLPIRLTKSDTNFLNPSDAQIINMVQRDGITTINKKTINNGNIIKNVVRLLNAQNQTNTVKIIDKIRNASDDLFALDFLLEVFFSFDANWIAMLFIFIFVFYH